MSSAKVSQFTSYNPSGYFNHFIVFKSMFNFPRPILIYTSASYLSIPQFDVKIH